MVFGKERIGSFERMTLRVTGMRFDDEFEAVCLGDAVEVSLYGLSCARGERRLFAKAVCSTDSFVEMLNGCGLASWDGFHGKHPKDVRDGIMFRLDATVDGGASIRADGSENFPKGYQELEKALYRMVRDAQSSERGPRADLCRSGSPDAGRMKSSP